MKCSILAAVTVIKWLNCQILISQNNKMKKSIQSEGKSASFLLNVYKYSEQVWTMIFCFRNNSMTSPCYTGTVRRTSIEETWKWTPLLIVYFYVLKI